MESENRDYETGEGSFFQGFNPDTNPIFEMQKLVLTQQNMCHACFFNNDKEVVLNKETKKCPCCEDEVNDYEDSEDDVESKIIEGVCPACGNISFTPYDEDGHCDYYCHYLTIMKAGSCWGCREEQQNQLAHMDPGGCLYKDACDKGLVEKD